MKNTLIRRLAPWACLLMAGPVVPAWADPALPFKNYQGWRDEPVADWRALNERVGEIGGWRTYLREAQTAGRPSPAPAAPVAPSAAPGRDGAPAQHSGH